MTLTTKKEQEKARRDIEIRAAFLDAQKVQRVGNRSNSTCRIATSMAESGRFGYKSVGGILASLRRTQTI